MKHSQKIKSLKRILVFQDSCDSHGFIAQWGGISPVGLHLHDNHETGVALSIIKISTISYDGVEYHSPELPQMAGYSASRLTATRQGVKTKNKSQSVLAAKCHSLRCGNRREELSGCAHSHSIKKCKVWMLSTAAQHESMSCPGGDQEGVQRGHS